MSKAILRKRILALTIALVIMTPLSAVAAKWQWNRHIERETRNALVTTNAALPISQLEDVLDGNTILSKNEWQRVEVVGHFDEEHQKLLRKQSLNGRPGFIVVTPFITNLNQRLLIERGWVAGDGQIPDPATSLAVDQEEQTITARIRILYGTAELDPKDLPPFQTNHISTMLTADTVIAYFELMDSASKEKLELLPWPELEAGPHLGYVGQWIIIGLSGIVVYIMVMRRLREEYRSEHQASDTKSA
jgi:cytochrome oxidase assembly protein ShyY1